METHAKPNALTRRQFLNRTSVAVGSAAFAFPYVGQVLGANERINIACIGVGGKGDSDSSDAARCGGNIVAICDVDKNTLAKKARQFANAKQYQDYRKLLDEMGKDIDAVTVSTPDHNHGVAAIRAMKLGKHCFCQKPLVQTVYEARMMRQTANEKKLATQMGNQGSAENGLPSRRSHPGRRDRRAQGTPRLVQPPDLAARIRPAHRRRPRACGAGLGCLARPGRQTPLQEGHLSHLRLARLV